MNDSDDRACRICGKVTKLSFEHVPPKSVGNAGRIEMLGIEAWLQREDEGADVKATISQKGSGAYSLCSECNSRAGKFYVPEFQKLHGTGMKALSELDLAGLDKQPEAGYVEMQIEGMHPAPLAKQIVTMLLAISPGGFAKANPELTEYARVPEKVGLPPRYQLYLVLYAGPNVRYCGGSVAMHLNEQGGFDSIPVWELAYPPFSYLLTIDEDAPPVETGNVTNFTSAGINDEGSVTMTLKVGFGHTALPLDFRTQATFEAQRKAVKRSQKRTGSRRGKELSRGHHERDRPCKARRRVGRDQQRKGRAWNAGSSQAGCDQEHGRESQGGSRAHNGQDPRPKRRLPRRANLSTKG